VRDDGADNPASIIGRCQSLTGLISLLRSSFVPITFSALEDINQLSHTVQRSRTSHLFHPNVLRKVVFTAFGTYLHSGVSVTPREAERSGSAVPMNSVRNSTIDSTQLREGRRAARILINKYAKELEIMLVSKGCAEDWLREVCDGEDIDFNTVMSSTSSRDVISSQLSPHEAPPSPPSSRHPSSSSTVISVSGSNQALSPSGPIKIVAIVNEAQERLSAKSISDSCYLIREDTVHTRLHMETETLLEPVMVRHNGKHQRSYERVSLVWAWSEQDIEYGRKQQSNFYVVPELPKIEVLLGDSGPEDILERKIASLSPPYWKAVLAFILTCKI
jgi:hypothetical protein